MTSQDTGSAGMVLHHLAKLPADSSNKTPLIILIHGLRSNEEDLFHFADELPSNFLIIAVRAPNAMGGGRYAWYQVDFSTGTPVIDAAEEAASRSMLIQFITGLRQHYTFDHTSVYLCGFSQGGAMAGSVALTRPDIVKGFALLSGRILDEIKPLVVSSQHLSRLSVFITHGSFDITIKIFYARASLAFLQSLGMHAIYKEFTEGHRISGDMMTALNAWLTEEMVRV